METALSFTLVLGFALLPVIAMARMSARPVRVPVRVRAKGRR